VSQSDFVTRGQALVNAGQFQEAVKVCRLGLLGRPTTVEGRVVLGQALLALKRFDEVLAEMRVALELDHTSIPAQALKGEALLRKGDHHAAAEVLQKVRALAPTDPRIAQLLAEAARVVGKVKPVAAGAAGYPADNPFSSETETKHYPHHADQEVTGRDGQEDTGRGDQEDTGAGQEDTGGNTLLAAPAPKNRPQPQPAMAPQRSPALFAGVEATGTLEVDPELEGIEVDSDDLDETVAPLARAARGRGGKRADPARAPASAAARAAPARSAPDRSAPAARNAARGRGEVSSVELGEDEIMEVDETIDVGRGPAARAPGALSAVRNAINQPSGPLADPPRMAPGPLGMRPAAGQGAQQPQLAQLIANQPHIMQMSPVPPAAPLPPAPAAPFNARSALAAALPTQAAMPVPTMPGPAVAAPGMSPASLAAAARQTVVAQPSQPVYPGPGAVMPQPAVPWAPPDARTMAPWAGGSPAPEPMGMPGMMPGPGMPARLGPDEATRQPMPIDPRFDAHLAALSDPSMSGGSPVVTEPSQMGKPLKTGMRKSRSRLQVALWILVGAAMIGGGVFAGFQIRALRLGKQIDALRTEAMKLAGADTWQGWIGARNRLDSVAQASGKLEHRAALARTRAVLAYEFGDGLAEAQAAVAGLAGQGGLDGELAAAFLALAQSDARAARAAADRALAIDGGDAGALYASSQAALLAGDLKAALDTGKKALEKEGRAMHAAGLARACVAATAWEEGLAAADQALKATPDHPGALIVRGVLLAEGGRIAPGNAAGTEIRGQLEKVVREGTRPLAEQPRGVSPAQVAYADLALARVDAARGNLDAARADMANALAVGLDEQRFAEEVVETTYAINLLDKCRAAADRALAAWPGSLRARATRAQVALAQGRRDEALALLAQAKDLTQLPRALAARGHARLAGNDLDGAATDFDAALKRAPRLEAALIGRARVELRSNNLDAARKRLEAVYKPGAASPALGAAYAQVLAAAGDPASREKARAALEKAAAAGALIDAGRAQLELARMLREVDQRGARAAYEQAIRAGVPEARLEGALFAFDDHRPAEGHKELEALAQEAGDRAPAALLVELVRARMLVGDHPGAVAALERLPKLPDVVAWQLDRERGRYALRRGDNGGAAQYLSRALESCGDDAETFLLAAEVASADVKQAKLVEKVQSLARARLKDRPEASIITGKLALADEKYQAAEAAYEKARTQLATASARRQAQAEFGRAVVAYNKRQDDMNAQNALKLAIALDPTLYNAYLFYADLVRDSAPEEAFDYVKKAVTYNPDFVDGWAMYGAIAHRLRKPQEVTAAIRRVNSLAPGSETLRQLQGLR
jgi:tetratricopeptide (TPR) repeat protein